MLGWALCKAAAHDWDVFAVFNRNGFAFHGVNIRQANLADPQAISRLFADIRPDAVVHAAALSSPEYCQGHPDESELVNVKASARIAALCAETGAPCVFTSSDMVFDGENAPYSEGAEARPVSIYGRHKLEAETVMRDNYPDVTVCRLPLMFGIGGPGAGGFFKTMLHRMGSGEELRLFIDEFRTPVSTDTAARGIMMALRGCRGKILHLGGPERVSRFELGRIMSEVFLDGNAPIAAVHQKDVVSAAPRPRDVSLDSALAFGMGYAPGSIREQMEAVRSGIVAGHGDVTVV